MILWPFHRKPRQSPDWRLTGEQRWAEIKRQGDYVLESREIECVDMNSGAVEWRDVAKQWSAYPSLVPQSFRPTQRVRRLP